MLINFGVKQALDITKDSTMNSLVNSAKVFTIAAHSAVGQRRKYSDAPYWTHCERVVATLDKFSQAPVSDEMRAAAWLHDTVEDTNVNLELIRDLFGNNVYHLVEMLTDVSRPEDGNRRARKALDLEHTKLASPEAKSIKLADLIDNAESIVDNDPGFAVVWLREKRALLEVLEDGDPELYAEAVRVYQECERKLNKQR
jgi:(p)ppGpp synthase/HD superfamily hydrolase